METRLISAADAAACATLHAASFGAARWDAAQLSGSLSLPSTRGWGVFDDAILRGFLLCQWIAGEAEILTFCVDPALRRQGLGARLLGEMTKAAQADKVGRFFLDVAADNAPAIALYVKQGFTLIGRREAYYVSGGKTVDALLYQKDLAQNP